MIQVPPKRARPIVEQFSGAARFAASAGARLIDELAAQIEWSRDQMSGLRPQASAWKVVPHLLSHPLLNAGHLSAHLGMGAQSAQNALGQLVDAGVLEERTGLRRNRVWQHSGIIRVLDHFAQSLIRASLDPVRSPRLAPTCEEDVRPG